MYHKEPTYIRKGKTIRHVESGHVDSYKSINAAKQRSRDLQLSSENKEPKLGNGFLLVDRSALG